MVSRTRPTIALVTALVLCGCGGSGGKALGSTLARVAANVAVAAVATAVSRRRGRSRRNEDEFEAPRIEVGQRFEVYEYAIISQEPARSALPLYPSEVVVDVGPEDITCDANSDCVVLTRASCCSCAQSGTVVAVRSDVLPRLSRELASACGDAICEPGTVGQSCEAEPHCVHGLCRLIPPFGAVPAAPEESTVDEATIPQGYD